jgi:hypothetical protein
MGARSSSRPYISSNVSSVNEYDEAADLNDRPKLFLSRSSSICSNLADDGKLGYRFTSADELEEVNFGPKAKLRPTFVSKKLDLSLRKLMIALLKSTPIVLSGITQRCLDWTEASSNIGSLSRKDFGHFSNERVK